MTDSIVGSKAMVNPYWTSLVTDISKLNRWSSTALTDPKGVDHA